MLARNLISDSIPPVKTTDRVSLVLDWMNEFKVSHLPVIQGQQFLKLISEDDLLECDDPDKPVGEVDSSVPRDLLVHEDNHIFEVIKRMGSHKLDLVPVLDDHKQYLGIITKNDLVEWLTPMVGASEPGGIIVLEIAPNNYSISEIGRICESNDAKILSLTMSTPPGGQVLFVTIKLNIRELSRVISTFERFDYKIASVFFDAEQMVDYQETYENLLRYLNI